MSQVAELRADCLGWLQCARAADRLQSTRSGRTSHELLRHACGCAGSCVSRGCLGALLPSHGGHVELERPPTGVFDATSRQAYAGYYARYRANYNEQVALMSQASTVSPAAVSHQAER
jgi:hypothetical protein